MTSPLCPADDLSKFGKSHKPLTAEVKPTDNIDLNKGTLFIPREENVQTIQHPVIVRLPQRERLIKNRFLESLYTKYPHLLPKRLPTSGIHSLTAPSRTEHYTTSYMHDFAPMGDRFELIRRPKLPSSLESRNQLALKDPFRAYAPGVFDNSITKQVSQNWPRESQPQRTLKKADKIYPKSSEYNDNYNRMGKIFQRLNIYSKNKAVVIKHQHTFPPFESRCYKLKGEE